MTLRRQLLIIVLLTLSLPWAGCQYARHIEGVLRDTQIETLNVLATSAVAQLSPQLPANPEDPVALYAFELSAAPILDGYDDEWQAFQTTGNSAATEITNHSDNTQVEDALAKNNDAVRNGKSATLLVAGVYKTALYLFIRIPDENIVYFNPTLNGANGDRLALQLDGAASNSPDILLSTSAPGKITNSIMQQQGVQGYLQENDTGYQMELMIPLAKLRSQPDGMAKLRITRFDTDKDSEQKQILVTGRVLLPDAKLNALLAYYADHSRRVQLVDPQGWIVASSGTLEQQHRLGSDIEQNADQEQDPAENENLWLQLWNSIRNQLYRWMLSDQREQRSAYPNRSSGRYRAGFISAVLNGKTLGLWQQRYRGEALSIVAVPIFATLDTVPTQDTAQTQHGNNTGPVKGAVIIEQASDAILSTSNTAISKLFNVSFAAIALITTALLIFASLLSWRIRRLAKAASDIINSDGEFTPQIQQSSAKDEIGDLYRSFVSLQQRIESYTSYLKSLAAKLSHELRTPLAMVSTSLENLQQTQKLTDDARVYTQRANDGIQRLRQLVNAMSAATHVEQSISTAEKETFDLATLVKNLTDSYQSLQHDKQLIIDICDAPLAYYGAPELIAQLIDKLWDNALEFTPAQGTIRFSLSANTDEIILSISNEGPLLPEGMQKQLFDSLVSIREHKSDQAHLGLGLHIAKLIAEFHHGTIQAFNLEDRSGACFALKLPR